MKYIEVARFGGPEQLQLHEEPTPAPGSGEVLIEVKASGINFADLVAVAGHYPPFPSAPFRPGVEVAGTVAAVGEGVQNLQIGQRVMSMMRGTGGGYASHAVVGAKGVVPLPDALDFAPATALFVQGLTAYFLLERGELQAGDTVLISSAAGGLGSLAVQIAKLKGAGKVIGLASPSKHQKVRALGADEVFDYTQSGWSKLVLDATGGKGADIYLDSQGDPGGEGLAALADGARWMVFGGQAGGGGGTMDSAGFMTLLFRSISIRGYSLYADLDKIGRALPELIGWVSEGKLKIEADDRFALSDAARAHEAIANRKTSGKVVLEP